MLYDQQNQEETHEKYSELEDAIAELIKQNELLQNKQMYYEDLLEKKDSEVKSAQKKAQELSKQMKDIKSKRQSATSLGTKNDMQSSFRSDRKQR